MKCKKMTCLYPSLFIFNKEKKKKKNTFSFSLLNIKCFCFKQNPTHISKLVEPTNPKKQSHNTTLKSAHDHSSLNKKKKEQTQRKLSVILEREVQ